MWFQAGEVERVPASARRFLEMMSELAIGWLLLDAAAIAHDAQAKLAQSDKDWAFYEGKKASATWFAHNVLPHVVSDARILASGDRSAIDLPEAAFATV
jgi:hypothetical protein